MDSHGLAVYDSTPHSTRTQLCQQFRCGVADTLTTCTDDSDLIYRLLSVGIDSNLAVECDVNVRTRGIINLYEDNRRRRIAVVGNSIQTSFEAVSYIGRWVNNDTLGRIPLRLP